MRGEQGVHAHELASLSMPGASLRGQTVVFSQSWMQDAMRCPERARRELLEPSFGYNDATACGTALHKHMEYRLGGASAADAHDQARAWLVRTSEQESFRYVKVAKQATMLGHLDNCIAGFEAHVVPQVPPGGLIEHKQAALLLELDGWRVVLEGTPDYVDPFGRVWDWKTAGSAYNVWEAVTWAIQPTAYCFLASQDIGTTITEFTYAVAVKPHGDIQFIDVERRQNDWDWLARMAEGFLNLVRLGIDKPWPVNHSHYLCSADWCPHWKTCRGAYIHPEPLTIGSKPTEGATRT